MQDGYLQRLASDHSVAIQLQLPRKSECDVVRQRFEFIPFAEDQYCVVKSLCGVLVPSEYKTESTRPSFVLLFVQLTIDFTSPPLPYSPILEAKMLTIRTDPLTFSLYALSLLLVASIVYVFGIIIYRLFYHPLSKYPGPFLAKITDAHIGWHAWTGDRHLHFYRCHEKYGRTMIPNSRLHPLIRLT